MSNVPTNLIPTRITGLPEYVGSSTLGYIPYVLEGRTYKVRFANIAAVGAVPSTRVIGTGNGLEGGGDLSQNRVISIIPHGVGYSQLDFTGVTAGVYGAADTIPSITVDETGRITNIADVPVVLSNYVPSSRTVTAGAGLTGGGQLNNNITIALNPSNATPQSLGVASAGTGTQAARDDHVHPAVDLTDTSETQGVLPLGRGGTGVALSPVVGAVIYADNDSLNQTIAGNAGQVLTSAGGLGAPYWQTITGTGTVTSVSVVTANGFAGTVANPDTTAAITVKTTVTGMVKGDGTAISAAAAGTDYVAPGAITGSGLTMATSRLLGRTTAGSGAVEEITVGTGLSLSGGSLVNSAPDQIVSLTGAGTTVVTGTYPNFTITSNDQYTGTVTSVAASGGTTGLSFTGSPITTSGTLTLGGTLVVANGGTGATTAAGARTNLGAAASGANSDITSLSGITGAISSPTYIQFGNGSGTTLAAGRMWYDQTTGSMNVGMGGGNITQQIGEEIFIYGKASAAITEGQVVVKTGAVGASGVITFAPAPLGTTDSQAIIGVATENIALNAFGRITSFGVVHGINTTGSAYGETWADGDTLYYNPNYVGGLTNVKPSAPNQKTEIGIVINAGSGGSGSIQVEIIHGTSLGGTDNNVQLTSPTDNDLLQYYAAGPYWRNLAPSSVSVGTATNLAGGAANRIAYQTGSGTTGFITAPSVANTFLEWSGSAFQWSSNPLGTVTSVAMTVPTGLTVSGSPITTSGTLAVSLQSGYSIPTTASQANWDTAYSERLQWDGGSSGLVAATGRTSLGATTVGSNFFTLTNPSAITFPQINADNTVSALSASAFRAAIGAGTGSGSVTSVDVSGGTTGLTTSGGPVTSSGTITLAGTLNVANGGTGATSLTSGYLIKGNGTSAVSSSIIYDSGTNVGIGIVPSTKLDVAGPIWSRPGGAAGAVAALFADASSGVNGITLSASFVTGGYGPIKLDAGGSERMRIDSSGNVGIGTSSPGQKLDVAGNVLLSGQSTADQFIRVGSGRSGNGYSYIDLQGDTTYSNGLRLIRINSGANANSNIEHRGTGALQLITQEAGPITFFTSASERMRLTSTGVLGLGIAGGDASFHIVGIRGGNGRMTQMSTGGTSQDNLNLIASSNSGGSDQWFSYGVTASNYFFIQNGVGAGSSGFVVASNNRVGIGIATPSGPLDVRASAGTTAIINSYNDSSSGNVASVFSNLQSNANSTSSYHYAGVTQGVNIWYLYGNGTSSWSSDQRLKKNIESTRDGYLDDLCRLRVVKYNWHTDAEDKPRELGLIAQEVEEVFPGLVEDALHTIDETETKYKVLKGSVLPYMLLKALQEANAKIEALTARVADLEGK